MKAAYTLVVALVLVGSTVGCGKTVTELRANGESVVNNGGSLLKKIMDAGVAVYDIVKKVVEDTKDNVVTVKEAVVGPVETPAK